MGPEGQSCRRQTRERYLPLKSLQHEFSTHNPFPSLGGLCQILPKITTWGRVPFVRDVHTARQLMDHFYRESFENRFSIAHLFNSSSFAVFFFRRPYLQIKFVDFYNNSIHFTINPTIWFPGQPNGGMDARMAAWFPGLDKYRLYDNGFLRGACMCHFHSSPILTLRGLCKDIDVDTIYSLKYSVNDLILKGIRNSDIRNYLEKPWKPTKNHEKP